MRCSHLASHNEGTVFWGFCFVLFFKVREEAPFLGNNFFLRGLSVPAEWGAETTVANSGVQSCQVPRSPIEVTGSSVGSLCAVAFWGGCPPPDLSLCA